MTSPTHTFIFRFLIYTCILLCTQFSVAQVKYETADDYLKHQNEYGAWSNMPLDSSITNFHNYSSRNLNGQTGMPSVPLIFQYTKRTLGFKLYDAPYASDLIKDEQVKFFKTKGPYASLTGVAGSKQEQRFKLLFSHTLKNNMNFTLAFNRYSGLGFYKKQQNFTNNVYFSTNYTSANGRVGYKAYVLYNKLKHQENGGIKYDTVFTDNVLINKNLLDINISNARRENRWTSVYANVWFRLNKHEDSSTVISHYLNYEVNYQSEYYKYNDAASGSDLFYQKFYLDTVSTNDSTHLKRLSNQIQYVLSLRPIHTDIKLGYKDEYNIAHQFQDSVIQNQFLTATLSHQGEKWMSGLSANYIVSGSNAGDYQLEWKNEFYLPVFKNKKPWILSLNALAEQRHADYIYNRWYSNHFVWSNSFVPTQTQQVEFKLQDKNWRWELGAFGQNVYHYLYFDKDAQATQYVGQIQNMTIYVKKDLLLFKHLGFDNSVYYQHTADTNVVRVPQYVIKSSLYYQGYLFKNHLWLQLGFQGEYDSRYTSYAYMPALNQYYLQNTKSGGNYPYIDFFLTARIKPVKFFIKIDHVFQGMLGSNYSLVANYIQPDRAFKFGLNWVFFD